MPVLYLPHGGGPLPLLGDSAHLSLIQFLQTISSRFERPKVILMISAHWEEKLPTLTSGERPPLIYDYGGFPPESYEIKYPAPGQPELAGSIQKLFKEIGISSVLDESRGFDHGMFVPLKLMYPDADIPCVQLSLIESLDPEEHILLGNALAPLLSQDVLIVGSGSSFHNMRALMSGREEDHASIEFNNWLIDTCTSTELDALEKKDRLKKWEQAPHARYCHPREEHLIPLHVCFGAALGRTAVTVFDDQLLSVSMAGFLWD